MQFDRLYCNGNIDPLGTGREIVLSWNYRAEGARNETQKAFRITVRPDDGTVYDSGRIEDSAMCFPLSDRFPVKPGVRYAWQVTAESGCGEVVSPVRYFETAGEDLADAAWITCGGEDVSAPVFERVFSVTSRVKKARAYVTGLGFFHCFQNGVSCSDRYLMPPNTLYDKICYFETFDITELVREGENRFSVWLGNGYDQTYSIYGYRYDGRKGCRCALVLTYENGETERILSDGTWVRHDSPVTENGLYAGEHYDARRTDFPCFPAVPDETAAPAGKLIPDEMPPVRAVKEYAPDASWTSGDRTVYDFGCNLQGIVRIETEAPAGTELVLSHSEMIFPDGTPDPETNRQARAEDRYVCAGTGREVWQPRFTYHGFRYLAVSGVGQTSYFSVKALQLSADVETGSTFSCSDASVNRIHALCCHSIRCNQVSIPTDCPVRDERTPCQMDSQMMEAAAIHNFNMESYYRKWLRDIVNTPYRQGEENPDWHGDYIMLAYRMYRFYGDASALVSLYPRIMDDIAAWVERTGDGVVGTGFGDWCLPNDNTWGTVGLCKAAVNTSLLYAYCMIAEEVSHMLGNAENEEKCRLMAEGIRAAFRTKYLHEDGSVGSGRQTDMVLPLYFGLLGEEDRKKTGDALLRRIREDGHLDTGGFGTMVLVSAAVFSGGGEELLKILQEGTYPGFGYWLARGATSLWEQWAYKGIMHSHSHAMYAGIDAAFYRVFCGITTVSPAYRTFRIAPQMPASMQFCHCLLKTASGDIEVSAERLYGGFELGLRIPPNTEAEVIFPDWETYADCMLFDGEREIEKRRTFPCGSGVYRFRLVPRQSLL